MRNDRHVEAEQLIDRLLDWALANRNTKHEFVSCYTYGHNADAKKFVGESTAHLKVLPDKDERGSPRKTA